MRTIRRTFLPDKINYNNKVYVRGGRTEKSIRVEVLSRRLRGVTDLYGNLYTPTVWYYNPE